MKVVLESKLLCVRLATTSFIRAEEPCVYCIPPSIWGFKFSESLSRDMSPPRVIPELSALIASRNNLVSFLIACIFIHESIHDVINHFAGSFIVTSALGVIDVTKPSSEVK